MGAGGGSVAATREKGERRDRERNGSQPETTAWKEGEKERKFNGNTLHTSQRLVFYHDLLASSRCQSLALALHELKARKGIEASDWRVGRDPLARSWRCRPARKFAAAAAVSCLWARRTLLENLIGMTRRGRGAGEWLLATELARWPMRRLHFIRVEFVGHELVAEGPMIDVACLCSDLACISQLPAEVRGSIKAVP